MRSCGGILLILAAAVSAQEIRCPTTEQAIRIDGLLDEKAWRQGPPPANIFESGHIHPNYRSKWKGPKDLSARIYARLSGHSLCLAIEVTDDARIHRPGRAWWAGDSIEVFFDSDLVSDEPGDRYSADDRQLFLLPFHESLRWGVVARGPEVTYPDGGFVGVEVAHRETGDGYIVEARIPLSNLRPWRPKDNSIGFDIAINDVDDPDAVQAETYMTLSGRFDLYNTPRHFVRLRLDPPPANGAEALAGTDWTGLLAVAGGLGLVLLLAGWLRRRVRRGGARTGTLCAVFAGAAVVCTLLPAIVGMVDAHLVRARHSDSIAAVKAAARAYIDLDAGSDDARAERLRLLLSTGTVHTQPRYRYHFIPLTKRAGHTPRYGIELAPGEQREFRLDGLTAPAELRLDLAQPEPGEREAATLPAGRVTVEFDEGEAATIDVPRAASNSVAMDLAGRAGTAMRLLRLRNLLSFQPLVLNAVVGRDDLGEWRPLPLAAQTPAGVPIDIWRDRPAAWIRSVKSGAVARFEVGMTGHRLWLALSSSGAYPETRYGEVVARIHVTYRGQSGPRSLEIVNGRDVQDQQLLYARGEPRHVAMEWEPPGDVRLPRHYTLHGVPLDPARVVDRVEVEHTGILGGLAVTALTVGRRDTAPPPTSSGLTLHGDTVTVRPESRTLLHGLGFTIRAGDGPAHPSGLRDGVTEAFDAGSGLGVTVILPRSAWAGSFIGAKGAIFALAALLAAVAAVLAGAGVLQRARRLRVKMLVALGAATAAPLVFLFVSLTTLLNDQAEARLEEATMADLRGLDDRISAASGRARSLASLARDRVEMVVSRGDAAIADAALRSRSEIEGRGAFLRMPGVDRAGPSPLGNVSLIDAVARSGLYYSPWDGLVALGVARAPQRRRYLVGLRAPALAAGPADANLAIVLYAPDGTPLATSGNISPVRRGDLRERLERSAGPLYVAREADRSSAHHLLRNQNRIVGIAGVYRLRTPTDAGKAAVMKTLLLSALAALLLVVLAGATLVERVTDRLGRVTRAAGAIAHGDLGSRVPIEAEDEVGRLAHSFNRMADSLHERERQLTELHTGLTELTGALDRTDVAIAAAELLQRTTGAKRVVVAAVDPGNERMETLHRIGESAPLGTRLPAQGPLHEAVAKKHPVRGEGSIFLPLAAGGRTVGVAVCSGLADLALDDNVLDLSGRQIGIALENARLYRAAVTDETTGLYTYAFFTRRLKEEVDRAAATGRPLSLLRVVIDDYHRRARAEGAAAATRLVAHAATTIGEVLPPRNMVARREGGELLVLLVEANENDARVQVDRVAAALRARDRETAFTYRSVTYPGDGEAADMLLDALFEATETFGPAGADSGPALQVPAALGLLLSKGPAMRAALEVVARVAPTDTTVLLAGETGSGKEVLADLVQCNSARATGPYLKINCAAIPETLIEAELFGHEKGAFTGADRRRAGCFEAAHKGTLFLDEIGELPLAMQVKLLRVLQEKTLTRVGGSSPTKTDVRILAASNRDLAEAVRQGLFREDLYHRIHVIELRVPPLRDRKEDIAPLVEHFRRALNRRHRLKIGSFSPDALDAMYRYPWPGNVRELRNVVERAMVMATGQRVEREQIELPDEPGTQTAPRVDGLTPRQERVLHRARESGGISNSDVVNEERVSPRTALRELQKLVDRGLLVRVGRRRGAVYRPPE